MYYMKFKYNSLILTFLYCSLTIAQTNYFEGFDAKGYPNNLPNNGYWMFYNDIHPTQTGWDNFMPGDGFAYITVDPDTSNDTDSTFPYQALVFGGVGENHKLEVRMKGAAVDGGLAAFIFTYTQTGPIFNEVDIEVVAQDLQSGIPSHDIFPPNGWTDARFNTWRDANEITTLPFTGSSKPIIDKDNNRKSLIDNEFHTYTIDWRANQVDFFIDDVLQESFNTNIARGFSEVIIGYRNLPWAGDFRWTGNHTMVIDYFKIEPLEPILLTDVNDFNNQISIYPNPVEDELNLKIDGIESIKKIELFSVLSSKIIEINTKYFDQNTSYKVDVSNLSKGIYFLKTEFNNGKIITKKVLKH